MNLPEDTIKTDLFRICPDFDRIKEIPIIDLTNEIIGWHSTSFLKNNIPFGSGTSSCRDTARRIAISESIERSIISSLEKNSHQRTELLFDEIPTSSGFAAGFDRIATKTRALFEGVERWAWSQWIDNKKMISKIDTSTINLNSLDKYLSKQFDNIIFFQQPIQFRNGVVLSNVYFYVIVAQIGSGVFAGSRVSENNEDGWGHCLIEAWRNLNNFNLYSKLESWPTDNWLTDRILFFGENGDLALKSIANARDPIWPIGEVRILKEVKINIRSAFVWRGLLKNFIPWHIGDKTRFVY